MRNSIKKDLFKGVYYTAIAKYSSLIVSLLVIAVLSRIISPEDFGIVAIATVVIQFFANFSDMGLQPAIIQYKRLTERDFSNIFSFTVWIGLILALLFFILSWPISDYYENKTLLSICQILSVNLFFATANIVPNALLYKEKKFKFIAYRTLSVQLIGGGISVVAALSGLGLYSLIISPVFSSVFLFIVNYHKYPQKLHLTLGLESIKSIFSYSFYQFLFGFVNYFARNIDKLIIGKYLGLNLLGFYEKSYRLMMLPLQAITQVVSQVMHPIFSEFQNDLKTLASSYEKVVRFLAFVGFPLSVILFFTAKELTLIIFGPNWMPSVPSFEILALSVGFQIVCSTSGSIFQAANSTKFLFISGLLSASLTITGIFIAIIIFKSLEAVAWSITITFVINFVQAYLIMYLAVFKRNIRHFINQLISPLILSAILIIANLVFNEFIQIDYLIPSFITKCTISLVIIILYIQFSRELDFFNLSFMKWYSNYLTVFEKPFEEVPVSTIDLIREKLKNKQSDKPVASVVVIAYNEERRLLSCLWSLSESECKYPVEIFGVDNSSVDRTASVYEAVGLRYYNESRKSPGYARNRGLQEAKGKYYICIDADTIYPPDYIETMIDALEKPGVVAASSLWSYVPSKEYPRFKMIFYELFRDIHLYLLSFKSPERCVRGLVFAHETEHGRQIGYNVNLKRGEDGSLAYHLMDYGKITFLRKRKARPVTCTSTLRTDGSLGKAFLNRVRKSIKGYRKYFIKYKGELKDQPSNLINRK